MFPAEFVVRAGLRHVVRAGLLLRTRRGGGPRWRRPLGWRLLGRTAPCTEGPSRVLGLGARRRCCRHCVRRGGCREHNLYTPLAVMVVANSTQNLKRSIRHCACARPGRGRSHLKSSWLEETWARGSESPHSAKGGWPAGGRTRRHTRGQTRDHMQRRCHWHTYWHTPAVWVHDGERVVDAKSARSRMLTAVRYKVPAYSKQSVTKREFA